MKCELCEKEGQTGSYTVEPEHPQFSSNIQICRVCSGQITGEQEIDSTHWFCLQSAIWSENPAVQVVAIRMLTTIGNSWATDILDQAYVDDLVSKWADANDANTDDRPPAYDSNGKQLSDGDSVTLIKDLDVKGTSFVAKRGTLVKGIRLTQNPQHVEGRVNKVAIVLKTQFLKKV